MLISNIIEHGEPATNALKRPNQGTEAIQNSKYINVSNGLLFHSRIKGSFIYNNKFRVAIPVLSHC